MPVHDPLPPPARAFPPGLRGRPCARRGYSPEDARAILIKARVLEFSQKLPCAKQRRRIEDAIEAIVPRMQERAGGEYSSI